MNNELAGYCSVLHALRLRGTTGVYGPRLRAAVIGFGATARGAVAALLALGVHDVTVLTQRDVPAVGSPMPPARLLQLTTDDGEAHRGTELRTPEQGSLPSILARHDIVVNCTLQDADDPLIFVTHEDLRGLPAGSLIIDVSCDEGMGFEWARPTSFDAPTFTVGQGVALLRGRPQPVVPVELRHMGDQRGPACPHLRTVMAGTGRVGRRARRSAARSRSTTA